MLQGFQGLGHRLGNLQHYLPVVLLPLSTGVALLASVSPAAADRIYSNGGVIIRIEESSPGTLYYDSDRGSYYGNQYPYAIEGADIEDSLLVNPVLIDSDVEDSTLVNPVLINSDVEDSEIWITRPRSTTGRYRSNCTVMADLRAACQ